MGDEDARASDIFRATARRPDVAAVVALGLLTAALVLSVVGTSLSFLTAFFLLRQDLILLAAAAVITVLLRRSLNPDALPLSTSRSRLFAAATLVTLVCVGGHYVILHGYDMSRDEQMASFDALIYASGHLVQPLKGFWQDNASALNTSFIYPADPRVAWISNYLPVNSAIRAAFLHLATPVLVNPLLAAAGLLALASCVRRIWPGDTEVLALAIIFYCTSGQVVITAMTSYAMTGHLALNLLWLAFLLRNNRAGDFGVVVVGFLATGLHQPLPHPLFAAPLLLWTTNQNRARGIWLLAAYCAIGLFWLWWPTYVGPLMQSPAAEPLRATDFGFASRLQFLFATRDSLGGLDMLANILRFCAWQPALLIPLALIGFPEVRTHGLAAALAGGVVLTLVAMLIILPYQGHGFGYRYLHGLVGNIILLAAYGWKSLRTALPEWRSLFRRTSLGTICVLLPLQAWFAHQFYAPYAEMRARLIALDTDYLIIGMADAPFASDLVGNRPSLDQRPIQLLRENVSGRLIDAMCAGKATVTIVMPAALQPIADTYGVQYRTADPAQLAKLRDTLGRAGCRTSEYP